MADVSKFWEMQMPTYRAWDDVNYKMRDTVMGTTVRKGLRSYNKC